MGKKQSIRRLEAQLDHYKRVAHTRIQLQVITAITAKTMFDAEVTTCDILDTTMENLYLMAKYGAYGATVTDTPPEWIHGPVRLVVTRDAHQGT